MTDIRNRVFFCRMTTGDIHKGVELPRHSVAFRRHWGCEFMTGEPNSEHLMWMAWQTITEGEGSFDDWLATVESFEVDVEDAAPLVRPSSTAPTGR